MNRSPREMVDMNHSPRETVDMNHYPRETVDMRAASHWHNRLEACMTSSCLCPVATEETSRVKLEQMRARGASGMKDCQAMVLMS